MKLKRLWLEDIEYGLFFASYKNNFTPVSSWRRIEDKLCIRDYIKESPPKCDELPEGLRVSCVNFPEDSPLLHIQTKRLLILSYQVFDDTLLTTLHKDVYYFRIDDWKLEQMGFNLETIQRLAALVYQGKGMTVLHQGELFFCNFKEKASPWNPKDYANLSKPLADQIRQLLFGCYDHRSTLFRLDPSTFNLIVYWLVELENAKQQYEEI